MRPLARRGGSGPDLGARAPRAPHESPGQRRKRAGERRRSVPPANGRGPAPGRGTGGRRACRTRSEWAANLTLLLVRTTPVRDLTALDRRAAFQAPEHADERTQDGRTDHGHGHEFRAYCRSVPAPDSLSPNHSSSTVDRTQRPRGAGGGSSLRSSSSPSGPTDPADMVRLPAGRRAGISGRLPPRRGKADPRSHSDPAAPAAAASAAAGRESRRRSPARLPRSARGP